MKEKIIRLLGGIPEEEAKELKNKVYKLEAKVNWLEKAAVADTEIIQNQQERYAALQRHHEKVMDSIKLVEVESTGDDTNAMFELLTCCVPYVHTSVGDEVPGKFFYIQVVEE